MEMVEGHPDQHIELDRVMAVAHQVHHKVMAAVHQDPLQQPYRQ